MANLSGFQMVPLAWSIYKKRIKSNFFCIKLSSLLGCHAPHMPTLPLLLLRTSCHFHRSSHLKFPRLRFPKPIRQSLLFFQSWYFSAKNLFVIVYYQLSSLWCSTSMHLHLSCSLTICCQLFFILYYGAGYVNMLQLLMVAGYTICMNMSIHNS
jgi:hypothetical protein